METRQNDDERRGRAAEDDASGSVRQPGRDAELEAEVRERAYARWVARGDAPGSDVDDWYAAERDVREARARDVRPASTQTTGSSTATGAGGERLRAPRGHSADDVRAARLGEADVDLA